jgi:hypothetical protein
VPNKKPRDVLFEKKVYEKSCNKRDSQKKETPLKEVEARDKSMIVSRTLLPAWPSAPPPCPHGPLLLDFVLVA